MIKAVKKRFTSRKQFAEAFGINKLWSADRATLLDVAIANGSDKVVGLIDETAAAHPEIAKGAARSVQETSYKTLVLVERPVVGFRRGNEGAVIKKGRWENRRVECYHFNPRWESDIAVADKYEDGPEAFIAMQAKVAMDASLAHVCKQFYYGNIAANGNDSKGFPGIVQAYDRALLEVDATGTQNRSSVYAVRWGATDCQFVWGGNASMEPTQVRMQDVDDADGNPFTAYVQEIMAHVGLQVGSKWSVGRLKNLGTDDGKGLTDALLGDLFDKFPASYKPDAFFMTTRSLGQLRKSRTATNPTGAEAPYPTDWNGVPIIVTDSISNAEASGL